MQGMWGAHDRGWTQLLEVLTVYWGRQVSTQVTLQVNGGTFRGMDYPSIHCTFIPDSSGFVGMRVSEFVTFPLVMLNCRKGRVSRPGVKSQLSH